MLSEDYRVCIHGPDSEAVSALQQILSSLQPVALETCLDDRHRLFAKLRKWRTQALLISLDPQVADSLELVRLLTANFPDLTVIGLSEDQNPHIIVSAIQAGCAQFLPLPTTQQQIITTFEQLGVALVPARAKGRCICLIGPSGGTGTTTVACNLALEMAKTGNCEIALVDLHLGMGNVAGSFALQPTKSVADLCHPGRSTDHTLIKQTVSALPCGVAVLPAPDQLADLPQLDHRELQHLLQSLSQLYRAVIIDTPRLPTEANWAAIDQAHAIMLVVQLTVPCLDNAHKLYKFLLEREIPKGRILLVINRFREDFGSLAIDDVEERFDHQVFATIPSDYDIVRASTDLSHPLLVDAPNNPVRLAICQIARLLLGVQDLPPDQPEHHQPRSLLPKLLSN